jgi:hypothetical protein
MPARERLVDLSSLRRSSVNDRASRCYRAAASSMREKPLLGSG